MKKALLIFTLMLSISASALNIPKKIIGQYDAEVPAFEFEDNGHTVHASAYTLSLILREDYLVYKTEHLEFNGVYKAVKDNGPLVDIDVAISNSISIDFDLDLQVNKKTGSIAIKGLKGVPEVTAIKREISVKRKGFKRL